MSVGPFQLLVIALIVLVLFGRGRISQFMGDFGKGVKNFRRGVGGDEADGAPARIDAAVAEAARAKPDLTAG